MDLTENYKMLAAAIVKSALLDYKSACKRLLLHPDDPMAQRQKKQLEDWFHSDEFIAISDLDADWMLEKIQEMVKKGGDAR